MPRSHSLCGDSLRGDQKSFRSLSDAPPARAQSARGAADVSGVMRRASQRVRSVRPRSAQNVQKAPVLCSVAARLTGYSCICIVSLFKSVFLNTWKELSFSD